MTLRRRPRIEIFHVFLHLKHTYRSSLTHTLAHACLTPARMVLRTHFLALETKQVYF
ncbi:MAG: hypothetical protein MJE68_03785 [Proteobacteria bacterium]|nr:hypothetical protein [Pseudomonadota bacterium]